jgi:hypothetical protein
VADALVKKSPAIGQINLIRNSNGAENNLQLNWMVNVTDGLARAMEFQLGLTRAMDFTNACTCNI